MVRPALGAVLLVATLAAAQEPAPSGDAPSAEAEEQARALEKGSDAQQEGTSPCSSSIRVTGLQLYGMNGVYFRDNSKMISGRETYWMMQGNYFTYKCGQHWYTTFASSYASVAAPGNTLCRYLTKWTDHLTTSVIFGIVYSGPVYQYDGTRNVAQPNARSACASNAHCSTAGRSGTYPCMCGSYRDGGCVTAQWCSPSASRKCSRCPAVRVHGIDAAINSMLGSIGQPAWAFLGFDGSYSRADHKMVKGRPTYWLDGDGSYFFYYCNKRWRMLSSSTTNWQALNSIADSACTAFLNSHQYDWHQDAPLGHASWQLYVGALSQWKQINHNDWYSVMTCPNADSHSTAHPTAYPTGYPAYSVESQHCIALGSDCYRTRYADADGNYGNGDSCTITVHSGPLRVQVIRFHTESVHDKLRVDGTPYSGTSSPHNAIAHNNLQWSSDGSITYPGWHICLHRLSVPTQYPTAPTQYPTWPTQWPTSPTQWPTSPTQWPTSPTQWPTAPTQWPTAPTSWPTTSLTRYPTAREEHHCVDLGFNCWRSRWEDHNSNYGNNDRCTIPLPGGHPARILVQRFDTEECCDKLIVDGVHYSGTNSPHGVTVRRTLVWQTDGSVVRAGWHICLVSQTGFPSDSPTGYPTRTGFPSRPPSGFPTGFPSQRTGAGPVTLSSCTARPGHYTVDGVQRNSPCFLGGRSRHVDHVSTYGDSARIYTCSIGTSNHHFVFCTCQGAVCGFNEEPRNCFVPADNSMGCVGRLRGAAFSGDGTKVFFACSKEVRVCRVDRSARNGNWYSGCQVVQDAGCPRWAGIRGIATRPRPNRGDLLVVVCTDWKTRSCSLHTDNMQMQPGRRCVKGGRERLCDGIGKPTAIAFSSANRLIVPCDSGYSYSRFVGGIVTDISHTPYNGAAPCPHETMAITELSPERALVACGPNGVRECQLQYA